MKGFRFKELFPFMLVSILRNFLPLSWVFALFLPTAATMAKEKASAVRSSGTEAEPPEVSPTSTNAPSTDTLLPRQQTTGTNRHRPVAKR